MCWRRLTPVRLEIDIFAHASIHRVYMVLVRDFASYYGRDARLSIHASRGEVRLKVYASYSLLAAENSASLI